MNTCNQLTIAHNRGSPKLEYQSQDKSLLQFKQFESDLQKKIEQFSEEKKKLTMTAMSASGIILIVMTS